MNGKTDRTQHAPAKPKTDTFQNCLYCEILLSSIANRMNPNLLGVFQN